jgi:hypothetical protein
MKSGITSPHRNAGGRLPDVTAAGGAMTPETTTLNAKRYTRWLECATAYSNVSCARGLAIMLERRNARLEVTLFRRVCLGLLQLRLCPPLRMLRSQMRSPLRDLGRGPPTKARAGEGKKSLAAGDPRYRTVRTSSKTSAATMMKSSGPTASAAPLSRSAISEPSTPFPQVLPRRWCSSPRESLPKISSVNA